MSDKVVVIFYVFLVFATIEIKMIYIKEMTYKIVLSVLVYMTESML